MAKKKNKHQGSSLDSFLKESGVYRDAKKKAQARTKKFLATVSSKAKSLKSAVKSLTSKDTLKQALGQVDALPDSFFGQESLDQKDLDQLIHLVEEEISQQPKEEPYFKKLKAKLEKFKEK